MEYTFIDPSNVLYTYIDSSNISKPPPRNVGIDIPDMDCLGLAILKEAGRTICFWFKVNETIQ